MATTEVFRFKAFSVDHNENAMKVGTDGVLLGAWANTSNRMKILDIGTGTGLIALMLAQKNNNAQITAVEIDEKAATLAQNNVNNSPWSSRIIVINQSIQNYARKAAEKYDLIVSNPPFFSGGTFSSSQDKALIRHTVKLAHSELLSSVRSLLQSDGSFEVILPYIEGLRLIELAKTYGLHAQHMTTVYPDESKKAERLLISFGKSACDQPMNESLYIRDETTKDYSNPYKALTKDFYINF